MMLSGAFGGAISGSILGAFTFLGLNLSALVPVCIVILLSGIALLRGKSANRATAE